MLEKKPEKVFELAIRGMLPKSKLGKAMAKKLKVYGDAEHPHTAQRPQPAAVNSTFKYEKKLELVPNNITS